MEDVDDLLKGFLGLILACHVPEGDPRLFLHIDLGVGLAYAADTSHTSHPGGHGPEQQEHEPHHEDGGQQGHQEGEKDGLGLHPIVLQPHLVHQGDKPHIGDGNAVVGGLAVLKGLNVNDTLFRLVHLLLEGLEGGGVDLVQRRTLLPKGVKVGNGVGKFFLKVIEKGIRRGVRGGRFSLGVQFGIDEILVGGHDHPGDLAVGDHLAEYRTPV